MHEANAELASAWPALLLLASANNIICITCFDTAIMPYIILYSGPSLIRIAWDRGLFEIFGLVNQWSFNGALDSFQLMHIKIAMNQRVREHSLL